MNSRFRARLARFAGRRWKSLIISVVILFEVAAIAIVATNAWVETVSSIKITNEANTTLTVDTYVFTDATIGGTSGTIDLGKYFKQAGDMHLAPASSADGDRFFFPKAGDATLYRKGDTSDKNTAYLSATFRLKADANADFFFDQTPTVNNNIRVSVTAYSEGTSDLYDHTTGAPLYTKIYANTATTAAVVNSTSGGTGATSVEAFSDHIKGKSSTARLFAVGANETKIVTINVWLQKVSTDMNSVMSASQAITNLGITSSLTPRHVTLIPTPTWDISSAQNQTFYAWCWMSTNESNHALYKLTSDSNEHYSFDYNGTYDRTLFFRCGNPNLETSSMTGDWSTLGLWNKTANTTIPNDPVDPTYIIETISGGAHDNDINGNKSTGSWHDPATITVATVTGQSSWGAVSATSYIGSSISSNVMEQTNSSATVHKNTVHAWPGKAIKLKAEPATNYAFVGWYTNAEGTGTAASTSATFTTTAPSTASEVTYYAKFKEVRTLSIYKYLDGANSSDACGTITIDGTTSGSGVLMYEKTVDKGSSVSFSASAATGYTLSGIYTTSTGNTTATSPVTLNANTSYYARFTTNTHSVTASAIGSTGSEVQVDSETKGTTCTKNQVKYNSSVTVKAFPANGYKFVGWYSNSGGTGNSVSTNAEYTFTLGDANVTYYAKFEAKNYYLKASWNNWSETQDQLTGTGNELTFEQELDPGQYEFKIFDGDLHWSNAYEYKNNYNSSTYLGASGGDTLNSSDNTGNMKLNTGTPDKYTFHFNKSTNKFWITKVDITYHVVGDITGGWSTGNNNKMTRVGSTDEYTYTVSVNGSKEFKILTSSGTWYGNGYRYHDDYYGDSGGDTFNSPGDNCTMDGSNKDYVFHFNSSTKKFWITDP